MFWKNESIIEPCQKGGIIMIRRTNEQIKEVLKAEYGAMHQAGCSSLAISRAIFGRYNPRLIIEAIQEWNDERPQTA